MIQLPVRGGHWRLAGSAVRQYRCRCRRAGQPSQTSRAVIRQPSLVSCLVSLSLCVSVTTTSAVQWITSPLQLPAHASSFALEFDWFSHTALTNFVSHRFQAKKCFWCIGPHVQKSQHAVGPQSITSTVMEIERRFDTLLKESSFSVFSFSLLRINLGA